MQDELSRDLVVSLAVYVGVLLVLGAIGRRAMREKSMSDFYLAGRSIGMFVLLLTLFATQYSGNSMSGFPGQTYRRGLAYLMSVTFMVGIVSGYLLFAPKLAHLGRRLGFITPTDYVAHRYGSRVLSYISATIFALTLFNFLLAQLLAVGHATDGLTGGRIPFVAGVAGGALVILVYELLGGMRAVVWTDVLQGVLLFVGMLVVAVLLTLRVGGPSEVALGIAERVPEKAFISDPSVCLVWISNFLLLGLGAPLYPQAIQRIFAARNVEVLKRALVGMAFLPLFGITTVVYIGAAGILLFPGLSDVEADGVTFRVLRHLTEVEPLAYVPVLLIMIGIIAAIMSTADSCLLSLSSIVSKDFVARWRGISPKESETLSRWTPVISTSAMAILVAVALTRPTTLWNLLVLKFELLIQLSPAFVLGTLHESGDVRAFRSNEILAGLVVGLTLALSLYGTGHRSVGGLHAGTMGVVANYLTVVLTRAIRIRQARFRDSKR